MARHHSARFCGHSHCGSGDQGTYKIPCGDIMFSVAEDSRRCRFYPPLLFISKGHGLKAHDISS